MKLSVYKSDVQSSREYSGMITRKIANAVYRASGTQGTVEVALEPGDGKFLTFIFEVLPHGPEAPTQSGNILRILPENFRVAVLSGLPLEKIDEACEVIGCPVNLYKKIVMQHYPEIGKVLINEDKLSEGIKVIWHDILDYIAYDPATATWPRYGPRDLQIIPRYRPKNKLLTLIGVMKNVEKLHNIVVDIKGKANRTFNDAYRHFNHALINNNATMALAIHKLLLDFSDGYEKLKGKYPDLAIGPDEMLIGTLNAIVNSVGEVGSEPFPMDSIKLISNIVRQSWSTIDSLDSSEVRETMDSSEVRELIKSNVNKSVFSYNQHNFRDTVSDYHFEEQLIRDLESMFPSGVRD